MRRPAWLLAMALALPFFGGAAGAHDLWISRQHMTNNAGEWCCGAHDCGVLGVSAVHIGPAGYEIHGNATIIGPDGPEQSYEVDDTVPYSEAQPSPDGAYWQCKRPDGSRRCFFAPPPGS